MRAAASLRALLLLFALRLASGRASIRVVRSSLGCGTASSSLWQRRICFGHPHLDGAYEVDGGPPLNWVSLNLSVQVLGADEAPQCGDALRVRFYSAAALFAPTTHREGPCGVHTMRFILPPEAPPFKVEVFVVHVDGEGMADPPTPRLYPVNLADTPSGDGDGPRLFNVRVMGLRGRLWAGREYVEMHAAQAHGRAEGSWREPPPPQLPRCRDGDTPGRWLLAPPRLYGGPTAATEPLTWAPYGCAWRHVTGASLRRCVTARGPVKFVGESTLGEVYELWQMQVNTSAPFWPRRIDVKHSRVLFETELMRARWWHLEYHGLSSAIPGLEESLAFLQPRVVLHLQGANDAARDTFDAFRLRVAEYAASLAAVRQRHPIIGKATLVWITAPTRHYKVAGAGPGSASCLNGSVASCRSSGTSEPHGSSLAWASRKSSPPLFFGTLDRRRAFNAHAVATMRAAFPDLRVVDYEALTAGLPSDFCFDGEHWGCAYPKWSPRRRNPFQCHSLAVTTLANIVANVAFADCLAEVGAPGEL